MTLYCVTWATNVSGLSFRILPGMFHYDPGQLLLWGRAKRNPVSRKGIDELWWW